MVSLRFDSHTSRFSVIAGVIIVGACVAVAMFNRQLMTADLQALAEQNNISLTRAFSNVIWPHYADFIGSAHRFDAAALRRDRKTADLRRDVLA